MSDNNPKLSLKDRAKTHLPATAIGIAIGAAVAAVVLNTSTTVVFNTPPGDAWLSDRMIKQIAEKGGGMIQIETDRFVDLIDWAHPANQK